MTVKKVGKVNWEEADVGKMNNDFVQMKEEGSYDFRIFTSPFQFYTHWTKDVSGKDVKVHCAVDDCPVCERGEKATARWYVGVISRKDDTYKILEVGPQVYQKLLALSKNPRWGDPKNYDITIVRGPKGKNPLYETQPNPKTDFTAEEKTKAKEFLSRVDFVKLTASPSPDDILKKLGLNSPASKHVVSDSFDDVSSSSEGTVDDDFNF